MDHFADVAAGRAAPEIMFDSALAALALADTAAQSRRIDARL
jgi:hypothetical protein